MIKLLFFYQETDKMLIFLPALHFFGKLVQELKVIFLKK